MDYRVEIDDEGVQAALNRALARFSDLTPLMEGVAGVLEDEAQSAFREQRSPKGRGWARLSEVTIALRTKSGHWPGKILQRSGRLAGSISSQVTPNSATVGTNVIYASVQQFGAPKRQFKGVARLKLADAIASVQVSRRWSSAMRSVKMHSSAAPRANTMSAGTRIQTSVSIHGECSNSAARACQ